MEGGEVKKYSAKKLGLDAYSASAKKKVPIKYITFVYRTPIKKDGKNTGKYRYRLSGISEEGKGLNRFINKETGDEITKKLGIKYTEYTPNPNAKPSRKKSCQEIGDSAKERCLINRGKAKKKTATKTKRKLKRPKKKAAYSSSDDSDSDTEEESIDISKVRSSKVPVETSSDDSSDSDDE